MLRVGLTGGIAAGKSVATARLRHHGVVVIDDDVLSREVIAPGTPGFQAVVDHFGPVVVADGDIDRSALGRIVFAEPAERHYLESVIHPAVAERAAQLEAAAAAKGEQLVVHDIPLLIETGQCHLFDQVLVVDAPAGLRLRRLTEGRGMDPAEAQRRLAAQVSDDERRAAASYLLDGSATPEYLISQVDRWLAGVGYCRPDGSDPMGRGMGVAQKSGPLSASMDQG